MNKILFFLALALFVPLINGGEIRNVEYALNITVTPYCVNNICTNATTNSTDNSTNITTFFNTTTCSSICYGKIAVNGIDKNQVFFEIDTGDKKWQNTTWELRYGYKAADLGNLSDISGIRDELKNLTATSIYLNLCNGNLTQCSVDKSSISTTLSTKELTITTQADEINKKNTERYYYLIGGLIAGLLFMWKGLPAIQGRRHPQDPSSKQFAGNAEYR